LGIQDELAVEWLRAAIADFHGHHVETPVPDLAIEPPKRGPGLERRVGFPGEQEAESEDCDESGTVHVARTVAGMSRNV
jgi:hypothetical protein